MGVHNGVIAQGNLYITGKLFLCVTCQRFEICADSNRHLSPVLTNLTSLQCLPLIPFLTGKMTHRTKTKSRQAGVNYGHNRLLQGDIFVLVPSAKSLWEFPIGFLITTANSTFWYFNFLFCNIIFTNDGHCYDFLCVNVILSSKKPILGCRQTALQMHDFNIIASWCCKGRVVTMLNA